ncbi:MAG: tetratricopeptide repeat protein [Labilithrix sp.]|nr:tetratricopeptide repeat protein [Labilithrix sp.]
MRTASVSQRPTSSSLAARALVFVVLLASMGCVTLRGRADDALERGDYRQAVDLYTQVLARKPGDARVRALLTRAERGLLDQVLDRADGARRGADEGAAMQAALEVVETKDRLHADSVDPPRAARVVATIDWATTTLRASVRAETTRGRALAARARRAGATAWLERPEVGALGAELDAEIAKAGAATCARATEAAAEQPFTLELVAAYCKEVGGAMPAWKARPLLVGGVAISGGILGTPPSEQVELERSVKEAVERSVWFTATTDARATAQIQGTVAAVFTREPAELARSWTESVPYEATETYQEAVEVPYVETETYTERVPYTAYEDRLETCQPPRTGLCNVSQPVTRYRDESRTREVRKVRTEYQTRTRQVTRYRDEPRIFRYRATKHEGRYQATFFVTVDLGSGLRAIEARGSAEDARFAHEHDAEFAPAGVHPERANLPSAMGWRQLQRDRVRDALASALDQGWTRAFCNEAVGSIEEAARCARARPKPTPVAVRARVLELFGDDPDRVLALPRPGEAIH